MINSNLLAPCGMYCGVCGIYIAHRDGNQKFKERLAPVYGLTPGDLHCEGCMAEPEKVIHFCRICHIRECALGRGYTGCHQCDEFPCTHIENFPIDVGKRVILRSVPRRREWGDMKWVTEEEKRYLCPRCGAKLFRGAKRCHECKEPADAD